LAKILSGGTDLLVQLKSGRLKPDLIIDTKRIPGLIGIREEADAFVIGAATPGEMLSANAALEHAFPGVVEGVAIGVGVTSGCGASPSNINIRSLVGVKPTAAVGLPGDASAIYVRRGVCSQASARELLGCVSSKG
jgi:carbon-monoxide dehydrogenase medium subunit